MPEWETNTLFLRQLKPKLLERIPYIDIPKGDKQPNEFTSHYKKPLICKPFYHSTKAKTRKSWRDIERDHLAYDAKFSVPQIHNNFHSENPRNVHLQIARKKQAKDDILLSIANITFEAESCWKPLDRAVETHTNIQTRRRLSQAKDSEETFRNIRAQVTLENYKRQNKNISLL